MTSDAKIGLLLGLVFIFIIAFIINGLPSLNRDSSHGDGLSIQDMNVPVNPQGLRIIQRELDSQEITSHEPAVSEPDADNPALPSENPTDNTFASDTQHEPAIVQPEPGQSDSGLFANHVEPAVNVQPTIPPSTVRIEVDTIEATPAEPQPIPEPAPAPTPEPKIHVVAQSETLASIAKRHYGPEEGNRRVNIQKIFEANRDQLESPDKIKIGQKLSIPPLPQAQTASNITAASTTASLIERFKARNSETTPIAAKMPQPTRWYVVKQGDDLWKIAANELGKGPRHQEIAKLNSDILPNPDNVSIGTRLRLPVK